MVLDGLPDPVRVRAAWVSDTDIAIMAARYLARRGDVIDTTAVDGADSPVHGTVIDLVPSTAAESVA